MTKPPVVPEFMVENLDRSLTFYTQTLEFRVVFYREDERFAYLDRGGVHVMLEEAAGSVRHFLLAPLEYPYGRGMNLQIQIPDVDAMYARVLKDGFKPYVPIEEKWYRQNDVEVGNKQFVIADPDGYLLRFYSDLGKRPV